MVARLLTLLAIVVSLVTFIAQETGSTHWWVYALNRASYVLVILGIAVALLVERRASLIVLAALVLTATAALAFTVVGLVKYYDAALNPYTYSNIFGWFVEAELLGSAVLAFGLTLARRRSTGAAAWLAAAVVMTLGSGTYAFTQKGGAEASVWWTIATVGAFLAAAAAAGLDRGGGGALSAPAASSAGAVPESDLGLN
jgi:peptidoglycan/LPS O-acetylase OafA/YrhL